jgi:hypothetical protein
MPGTGSRHAHPEDVRVPVLVHVDAEALEDNDLLEVDAVKDIGEAAWRVEWVAFAAEVDVTDEEWARELLRRTCETREEVEDAMVKSVARTPIEPLPVRQLQSTAEQHI